MQQNDDYLKKRLDIVKAAIEIGAVKASAVYKLSRQTISKWIKRYQLSGVDGLKNLSRKSQNHPGKMPEQLTEAISEIISENETVSAAKINELLNTGFTLKTVRKKIKMIRDSMSDNMPSFTIIITIKKIKTQPANPKLPGYAIKAYDSESGIVFLSYSFENNLHNMSIFIDYLLSWLGRKRPNRFTISIRNSRFFSNPKKSDIYKKIFLNKFNAEINCSNSGSRRIIDFDPYHENLTTNENDLVNSTFLFLTNYNFKVMSETNNTSSFTNLFLIPIIADRYFKDFNKLLSEKEYWFSGNPDISDIRKKYINNQFKAALNHKYYCSYEEAEKILSKILFQVKNEPEYVNEKIRSIVELSVIKLFSGNRKQSDIMLESAMEDAVVNLKYDWQFRIRLMLLKSQIIRGIKSPDLSLLNKTHLNRLIKNKIDLGYTYFDMGFITNNVGKISDAEKFYTKAYNISLDSNDRYLYFSVMRAFSIYYFNTGKMPKYLFYLKKMEKVAFRTNIPDLTAFIYYNYAQQNCRIGNIPKAYDHILKAISNADDSGQIQLRIPVYTYSAYIKANLNDFGQAISDANHSVTLSKADNNYLTLGNSYYILGFIYEMKQDYTRSALYYKQALKISKTTGNTIQLLSNYSNLSRVYYTAGDYQKAVNVIQIEYRIARACKNDLGIIRALHDYIDVFTKMENWDKVLFYLNKQLSKSHESRNSNILYMVETDIGNFHFSRSNYAKALEYFDMASRTAKTLKSDNYLLESIFNKSKAFLKLNKREEAIKVITTCRRLAEKTVDDQVLADIIDLCSENQVSISFNK